MKGRKITRAKSLMDLANKRKSVSVTLWEQKHTPAAFLMGMQFRLVMGWLKSGFIYEYKQENKNEK